jgi:hypothetical protein
VSRPLEEDEGRKIEDGVGNRTAGIDMWAAQLSSDFMICSEVARVVDDEFDACEVRLSDSVC